MLRLILIQALLVLFFSSVQCRELFTALTPQSLGFYRCFKGLGYTRIALQIESTLKGVSDRERQNILDAHSAGL